MALDRSPYIYFAHSTFSLGSSALFAVRTLLEVALQLVRASNLLGSALPKIRYFELSKAFAQCHPY